MKVIVFFAPLLAAATCSSCVTSSNTPCVFPFTHKNVTHVGCTLQHAVDGLAWCSTKVDTAGKHVTGQDAWGACSHNCPRDVVCRTLKVKDLDEDFASGLFVFEEIVHKKKPVYENKEKELGHSLQLSIDLSESIFYSK